MKKQTQFSGSTPPEIFVGEYGYPKINTGILSPTEYGNTEKFSTPEYWFKNNLSIKEILNYRNQLLYARFQTDIKKFNTKLKPSLDQVALSKKSISAEFTLSKPAIFSPIKDKSVPLIGHPAPLTKIRLEENPKIPTKVEYISNDTKLKSMQGIKELYKFKTPVSNIIKVLSAGLLGLKNNRRMVPTKRAITATDDTLSKQMLEKIRFFPQINEFQVFEANFLGNYYQILLMPDIFSFEVIELSELSPQNASQDHETFSGKKKYAFNVTGAYYANRLALCEYLTKKQKQATAIFFREIRPEYNSPMGVGILRETSRHAFNKNPIKFQTLPEALNHINSQLKTDINYYKNKSYILENFGKQQRLSQWF